MSDTPHHKIRIRDVSTDGAPLTDEGNGVEIHRLWVAFDIKTGIPLAMDEDRGRAFEVGVENRQQLMERQEEKD